MIDDFTAQISDCEVAAIITCNFVVMLHAHVHSHTHLHAWT